MEENTRRPHVPGPKDLPAAPAAYHILLNPPVLPGASTLITLELKVDTCPCCCVPTTATTGHTSSSRRFMTPPLDDASTAPTFTPACRWVSSAPARTSTGPCGRRSKRARGSGGRVREDEAGGAGEEVLTSATWWARSWSASAQYQGPRCTRATLRPSWLNYAANTWGGTLEHLSIVETEYPHAGAERGGEVRAAGRQAGTSTFTSPRS